VGPDGSEQPTTTRLLTPTQPVNPFLPLDLVLLLLLILVNLLLLALRRRRLTRIRSRIRIRSRGRDNGISSSRGDDPMQGSCGAVPSHNIA
jgi:hypothetical protein